MPYIEVMGHDGLAVQTNYTIGSAHEKRYYRVMTEDHGKMFFITPNDYNRWLKYGRPYRGVSRSAEKSTKTGNGAHRGKNRHLTLELDDVPFEDGIENAEYAENAEDAEG